MVARRWSDPIKIPKRPGIWRALLSVELSADPSAGIDLHFDFLQWRAVGPRRAGKANCALVEPRRARDHGLHVDRADTRLAPDRFVITLFAAQRHVAPGHPFAHEAAVMHFATSET